MNEEKSMIQNNGNEIFQKAGAALAEIEHTLDQMLLLAQLSAGDMKVDRAALQKNAGAAPEEN